MDPGAASPSSDRALAPAAKSASPAERPLFLALALAGLSALALLPLALAEIPPLVDYPNHLARMHVLAAHGSSEALRANYAIDWRPVPNLAMDLIVPPLARLMSVVDAGRVFIALGFAAIVGGACALHRVVHGRFGFWPLASFLVLYSLPLAWGFLNFYLSAGLFLLLLAAWLASAGWPPLRRVALFNLATCALYFTHLFGLVAYALAVLAHEAWRARREKEGALGRLAAALGQLALPALLHLANATGGERGLEPLAIGSWYGDLLAKSTALLAPFLFHGGAADYALAVLALALAAMALLRGWLAPCLRWPLAALLLATLAAPHVWRGLFLDARIGFMLGCLAVAAMRPRFPGRAASLALHGALAALFALKIAAIATLWQPRDRELAELRKALHAVPVGARVLSAHDLPETDAAAPVRWLMALPALPPGLRPELAWRNLETLAVLERDAYSPILFKHPSAQPIRSSPALREIDPVAPARRLSLELLRLAAEPARNAEAIARRRSPGERAFWSDWPRRFEIVLVFRYAGPDRANPAPAHLAPIAAGSFFDLYAVRR